MTSLWKAHSASLATTTGVAYILCAIFDTLFPPYGMIAALSAHSPWPLLGSPLGVLAGFATFTAAGLIFGALYGFAWEFWSKKLR